MGTYENLWEVCERPCFSSFSLVRWSVGRHEKGPRRVVTAWPFLESSVDSGRHAVRGPVWTHRRGRNRLAWDVLMLVSLPVPPRPSGGTVFQRLNIRTSQWQSNKLARRRQPPPPAGGPGLLTGRFAARREQSMCHIDPLPPVPERIFFERSVPAAFADYISTIRPFHCQKPHTGAAALLSSPGYFRSKDGARHSISTQLLCAPFLYFRSVFISRTNS